MSDPRTSRAGCQRPVVLFQGVGITFRGVRAWLPLAVELRRRGYRPMFLVDDSCGEEWLRKCRDENIPYQILGAPPMSDGAGGGNGGWVAWRTVRIPWKRAVPFRGWIRVWLMLRHALQEARRIIAETKPGLVVLFSDAFGVLNWALVRVTNNAGIPNLVMPLSTGTPSPGLAMLHRMERSAYVAEHSLRPLLHRVVARVCPHWVSDYRGERMFYHPINMNVVASCYRMLPLIPYSVAGGRASRIVVSSVSARDFLVTEGVGAAKLAVTGFPEDDGLAGDLQRARRDRAGLCGELGVDPARNIILFHPPAVWDDWRTLHDFKDPRALYRDKESYLRDIEDQLALLTRIPNATVVMTLHPHPEFDKIVEQHVQWAQRYGAVLSRVSVARLMAVCHVYVSWWSTTIRYAIGAEKPVLLLLYRRRRETESQFKSRQTAYAGTGVVTIYSRDDLETWIRRVMHDQIVYDELVKAQRAAAPQFAVLDGRCTERVMDQIEILVPAGSAA